MYLATINVPGYLPMDDEPPVFRTAADAWAYLESEREDSETDIDDDDYFVASECLTELRRIAEAAQSTSVFIDEVDEGTVYGGTPGYDGDHDLGLAYSVTYLDEHDERAYPLGTTVRLDCGCLAHKLRTTGMGMTCLAEDQGYCNFEHACGED